MTASPLARLTDALFLGALLPTIMACGPASQPAPVAATAAPSSSSVAEPAALPKATVGGQGSVTGGKISGADKVVNSARSRVRACYQSELSNDPAAQGSATFMLVIGSDGAVADAQFTLLGALSKRAGDCMLGVLRSLRFDPPESAEARLTGSFTFAPSNKGK